MSRRTLSFVGSPILVVGLFIWSLWAFSSFPLGPKDVWPLLTGGTRGTMTEIVAQIRLPRALVALLIGASMGLTGALMQGVSRNRLASPSLLGVTGGASLALACTTSGLIAVQIPSSVAATLGGAVAWCLVLTLGSAFSVDASRIRLVLAGMTMAALCSGLTRLVVLLAEERALGVLNWLAGSLANTDYHDVRLLAPVLLMGVIGSTVVANRLNILALGDEAAQAMGVRILPLRAFVFALGCLMTGSCVAVAGPLAFIGLIAPNLAYMLVGADYRFAQPLAALLGAALLLGSDILSRAVAFPSETPAGAVTALVGAPVFLWIARRI